MEPENAATRVPSAFAAQIIGQILGRNGTDRTPVQQTKLHAVYGRAEQLPCGMRVFVSA